MQNNGSGRIFIVGMPRSGSTLLETTLGMNPEIKSLGETRSLGKAIEAIKQQPEILFKGESLDKIYSQMEPFDSNKYQYTTDKQLYNFINLNWIIAHMPKSKIIHCRRNPVDNILSIYRSNLTAGNSYTTNLEDSNYYSGTRTVHASSKEHAF